MVLTGYLPSGLIAVGIMFIGSRFFWNPGVASRDFGIANSPPSSTRFTGWLAVKSGRDIIPGIFLLLIMANGAPRWLAEFLLVASLIAIGDCAIVLRSGGSRSTAFGMHGVTALVTSRSARPSSPQPTDRRET